MDNSGDNPVTHLVAALFFLLALSGSLLVVRRTVQDYRDDILAAMAGEPLRAKPASPAPRFSETRRPRSFGPRAMPRRRAA